MASSLADTLNLLQCLTARRIINYFVLRISYMWSVILGKPVHWGQPVFVSIEPTTRCNFSCPACITGSGKLTRPTGDIDITTFKEIIEKLPRETAYITLYFQGEPFLNKDFFQLIKAAKARKRYVAVSTNGSFLDETNCHKLISSGVDRLIVSIDGPDKCSYMQYRVNGNFENVCKGLQTLSRIRTESKSSKPFIILQSLVFKQNESRLSEIIKLGKDLGADAVELKSMQVNDFEVCGHFIPDNKRFSRYFLEGKGKWNLRGKMANRCRRMWEGCIITWDANVLPCCFDKDGSYVLGDMNTNKLAEIWKGNEYREFRRNVFTRRSEIPICGNCTESIK